MLNGGYAYVTIINSKYHGETLLSHLASTSYPTNSTSLATETKQRRSHSQRRNRHPGSESVALGQIALSGTVHPRSSQTPPQSTSKSCLKTPPSVSRQQARRAAHSLPGGGFMENTLLRLVQKQTPDANPVHRLGRATTGIVLFAKTPQAAAANLFCKLEHTENPKNLPGAGSKRRTARRSMKS